MAKKFPYTQLTLKALRKEGYKTGIVERWIQAARKRIDLFGIIDIVCMGCGQILGVQSTSDGKRREHLKTMLEDQRENTIDWLSNKGGLWLITWKKSEAKGRGLKYLGRVEEFFLGENGPEVRTITLTGEENGKDGTPDVSAE